MHDKRNSKFYFYHVIGVFFKCHKICESEKNVYQLLKKKISIANNIKYTSCVLNILCCKSYSTKQKLYTNHVFEKITGYIMVLCGCYSL